MQSERNTGRTEMHEVNSKSKVRYFNFWEVYSFLLVDFTPHNLTINSVAHHETL